MEPDRYQHSPKVYIIGLICMIISMVLFGLGAYILPNVAFGLNYKIPDFIYDWINVIQVAYELNEKKAGWLVVLIIFFLGFASSIITYSVSNRLDNEVYAIVPEKEKEEEKASVKWRETGPLVLKIILIIVFVFIIAKLFPWVISTF